MVSRIPVLKDSNQERKLFRGVTVAVRGTTHFSDSEKFGRIYGGDYFGNGKKWTSISFNKFVETFQDELWKGNFVGDTKHGHHRDEKN